MALVLGLYSACRAQGTSAPAYPESIDGLKSLMRDIYTAIEQGDEERVHVLTKSLMLPNHETWYVQVFGDDVGAKAAADYGRLLPFFDENGLMAESYREIVDAGRSQISAERFERAPDRDANGNQNATLAAMENPVPLYSVRFIEQGERYGTHVYSFAYVDGTFRWIGKRIPMEQR